MAGPINPLLLTAALSGAAVLGYLSYRALDIGSADVETRAPGAASTLEPAELPDSLPDIVLDDLAGNRLPLADWTGRPMLINFWATWCAPCLREIPLLKEFQNEHDSLTVVGVAVDRFEAVESFAAEMNFNYPVLVGQSDAMNAAAAFGVDVFALPFTVFVDAGGATLGVHTGELHPEHLENLAAVLTERAADGLGLDAARARLAGRR